MIPAWTMAGILPPIRPGQPGHSADRSPYGASLSEVVERFSTSSQRIAILKGLFAYRSAFHQLGIVTGFQWLNGSFMQDVEAQESRPPNDIDAVTYFYMPSGETQATLFAKAGQLFDNRHVKASYLVDAYPSVLGERTEDRHVRQISYWYSMWSHQRDRMWKGFVQISLDPMQDKEAEHVFSAVQARGTIS